MLNYNWSPYNVLCGHCLESFIYGTFGYHQQDPVSAARVIPDFFCISLYKSSFFLLFFLPAERSFTCVDRVSPTLRLCRGAAADRDQRVKITCTETIITSADKSRWQYSLDETLFSRRLEPSEIIIATTDFVTIAQSRGK